MIGHFLGVSDEPIEEKKPQVCGGKNCIPRENGMYACCDGRGDSCANFEPLITKELRAAIGSGVGRCLAKTGS